MFMTPLAQIQTCLVLFTMIGFVKQGKCGGINSMLLAIYANVA